MRSVLKIDVKQQRKDKMKNICGMTIFIIIAGILSAHATLLVDSKKIYTANQVTVYDFTVTIDGAVNKKKVFIVNDGLKNPKKFIWIFHGYKPDGDPYSQSPRIFIENWKLIQLCVKNDFISIVPDMGTSMYPMTGMLDEKNFRTITDQLHRDLSLIPTCPHAKVPHHRRVIRQPDRPVQIGVPDHCVLEQDRIGDRVQPRPICRIDVPDPRVKQSVVLRVRGRRVGIS